MLAVFLGALSGAIAFLPLFASLYLSKKITPKGYLSYTSLALLGVFVSLLILFVATLTCYFVANEYLIKFALSCAITLAVFAIAYGIIKSVKYNQAKKSRLNKDNNNNKSEETDFKSAKIGYKAKETDSDNIEK